MLGLMRVSGGVGTSKILASSDFLNFRADRAVSSRAYAAMLRAVTRQPHDASARRSPSTGPVQTAPETVPR